MKTESRETKSYYNVYVANDGTEFRDQKECEKYEETAECVITAKFKNLVKKSEREDSIIPDSCGDTTLHFVLMETNDDVDTVGQLVCIGCSKDSDYTKGIMAKLSEAKESKSVIAIWENYEGEYGIMGTEKDLVDPISKAFSLTDE